WPLKEAQEAQAELTAAAALLSFHSHRAQGAYREYRAAEPLTSYAVALTALRQMLSHDGALLQGLAYLQHEDITGRPEVGEAALSWLVLTLTQWAQRLQEEAGRVLRLLSQPTPPPPAKLAAASQPIESSESPWMQRPGLA